MLEAEFNIIKEINIWILWKTFGNLSITLRRASHRKNYTGGASCAPIPMDKGKSLVWISSIHEMFLKLVYATYNKFVFFTMFFSDYSNSVVVVCDWADFLLEFLLTKF